jgi:hypothetical protein
MMEATGSCAGIENYSRYLTGRLPGEPPPTLFEYIPDNACLSSTKATSPCRRSAACTRRLPPQGTLAEYGFRLPSCMDNRPLKLRGMGRDAPADGLRLGHPRRLGDGADRRRLHRTGDPPHRPDRPAGRNPPGRDAGRRLLDEIRKVAPPATARSSPC